MIWLWIYRAVMACYAAFIAFILAEKFPSFFGNPVLQFAGVGAGILILYYLWLNKPVSESTEESEVSLTDTIKSEGK